MDTSTVVANILRICKEKGTSPTVACKESGAGKDMVTNMKKKGTQPSIERIRLLAEYLGVTAGDLLGEKEKPATVSGDGQDPNTVRIAGRDGSLFSKRLTDEQLAALKSIIEQMPEANADYL